MVGQECVSLLRRVAYGMKVERGVVLLAFQGQFEPFSTFADLKECEIIFLFPVCGFRFRIPCDKALTLDKACLLFVLRKETLANVQVAVLFLLRTSAD